MKQIDKEALVDIARDAGEIQKKRYGQVLETIQKSGHDYATSCDIECQRLITERLKREKLPYRIIGEEKGESFPLILGQEGTLYIDPLEGTHNFRNGRGNFGVTLGAVEGDKPVYVVFYNPITDELYVGDAEKGYSCVNEEKMEVSDRECNWDIIFNHWPEVKEVGPYLDKLRTITYYTPTTCSDAVDLCMVAGGEKGGKVGRADALVYVYKSAEPWDIIPALVVELAGGVVTDMNGREWYTVDKGNLVVRNGLLAGPKNIHQKLLELYK